MFGKLKDWFTTKAVGSITRHLLSAVGGFLAITGLDPKIIEQFTGSAEAIIVGLIAYFLAQGASLGKAAKENAKK